MYTPNADADNLSATAAAAVAAVAAANCDATSNTTCFDERPASKQHNQPCTAFCITGRGLDGATRAPDSYMRAASLDHNLHGQLLTFSCCHLHDATCTPPGQKTVHRQGIECAQTIRPQKIHSPEMGGPIFRVPGSISTWFVKSCLPGAITDPTRIHFLHGCAAPAVA